MKTSIKRFSSVLLALIFVFSMLQTAYVHATDTEDAPTTETEAPTTDTEAPTTETEPPTTETEPPTTDTEPPTTETEAPTTDTEAPTTDTEAPTTDTEAPTTETEPPTTDTEDTPVQHVCTYGDWESNGDGTHTRTCKEDNSHTETKECAGESDTAELCAVCGDALHTHSYDASVWQYDEASHWHECSCKKKLEVAEHSYSDSADVTCDCGYTRTIKTIDIKNAEVTVTSTHVYDGTEQIPEVTVILNEVTLEQDTHYTVTAADNINAGTAEFSVVGIGSYSGTVTSTFRIAKSTSRKAPAEGVGYVIDYTEGTITIDEDCEVVTDEVEVIDGSSITAYFGETLLIRYKEDENYTASPYTDIKVKSHSFSKCEIESIVSNKDETHTVTCIHELTKLVDCTDDDSDGDELCDDCGYKLRHVHDWSSEWSADETHHWYDCTDADCPLDDDSEKKSYDAHTFEFESDEDVHIGVCVECDEIVLSPHDEPTYSELETDETMHIELCDTCDYSVIKPHELGELYYDDTHHWGVCECGYGLDEADKLEHVYDYEILDESGCVKYCTECEWEAEIFVDHIDTAPLDHICDVCDSDIEHDVTYSKTAEEDTGVHIAKCNDCEYMGFAECAFDELDSNHYRHWYICSVCESIETDSAEIHIDGDADNICNLCEAECGELAVHVYASGVCTICGAAAPTAALPIAESTSVIDVQIEWSEMVFVYSKQWDSETLTEVWVWQESDNYIKVENRSEVDVECDITFAGANGYADDAVEFSRAEMSNAVWDGATLYLEGIQAESEEAAPCGIINVDIADDVSMDPEGDLSVILGYITLVVSVTDS